MRYIHSLRAKKVRTKSKWGFRGAPPKNVSPLKRLKRKNEVSFKSKEVIHSVYILWFETPCIRGQIDTGLSSHQPIERNVFYNNKKMLEFKHFLSESFVKSLGVNKIIAETNKAFGWQKT